MFWTFFRIWKEINTCFVVSMKTAKVTKSNLIAISEIYNSLIHSLPHKDASLINFDFCRTKYKTEIQTKCTQTEMHTNRKTNKQKCIETEIQWKPLNVIALEEVQTDIINWMITLQNQWSGSGPFWSHKANDNYQLVYVINLKNKNIFTFSP